MKKCLPIILIIAFFVLVLQVVVNMFISERSVEYVLRTDDNEYMITEDMRVVDDVQYYDFTVVDNAEAFYTFSFNGDFNRQSEIIKDIKYFTSGDLTCIFPVYLKDKYGDVSCISNGEQVSYSYLKQINDASISGVINALSTMGYENSEWNRADTPKTELADGNRGIYIYQDNVMEDYTFLIWRYRGLYILKNEKSTVKDFLQHDQYENKLSALVGKYYVAADPNTEGFKISELSYYNTDELGRGTIGLPDATSNDYYFNGVFKDKLYMTDVGNGKQFRIDPVFERVTEVGNKDTEFVTVENGKLVKVKPEEFLSEKVYFTDYVVNEDITKKFGESVQVLKSRKFYYIRTTEGKVYRAHEDNIDKPVLLFSFSNLTEWNVKNGDVLAVAGNMVYFYNDDTGLLPIAENNELNYNHYNICDFWKKS